MSDTLGLACRDLGGELYEVLHGLDPARWRDELAHSVRLRLEQLARKARELAARFDRHGVALRAQVDTQERHQELLAWLEHLGHAAETALQETKQHQPDWAALRARLSTTYDALGRMLHGRVPPLPRERPTNYRRNAYHVGNALVVLFLVQHVLTTTGMIAVASAFALFAWGCETVRRLSPAANRALMKVWGQVSHPDENWRINSATWMCTALVILALSFEPVVCSLAVAVLGFADPAAALVGRRWGRHKLVGNRTWEGSAAFVVAGTLVGWAVLAIYGDFGPGRAALVALAGALPAAVAEAISGRLDDNLTVPVTAALGAAGMVAVLGG